MKTYTQLTREKRYQMFVLLTFNNRGQHSLSPIMLEEFCIVDC